MKVVRWYDSKTEHKRRSDASPVEFCQRSLAGGNVWDSLADLLKIMKPQGVGADDVKEVREIVQHLFTSIVKPARSKRNSRQAKTHVDHLLFQLVDDMHSIWDTDYFLDRAHELVKKAINEHAEYNIAELDRSRPLKNGAVTRTQFSEQVTVNTHTIFKAQVNEHEATGKANRIHVRQGLSDWQLADRFDKDRPVLFLPGSCWSGQHEPEFESAGWWQKPTRRAKCKQCAQCEVVKEFGKDFHKTQWQVLCVQRKDPNDESKTTTAADRHDLHQCRSEVCWQNRRQARRRHYCDDVESYRSNCFECGIGGRVNMVVAHIGENGLSLATDRWGRGRGESRGFIQQPTSTWSLSGVSLGACDQWLYFGWKSGMLQQRTWTDTNAVSQWMEYEDDCFYYL